MGLFFGWMLLAVLVGFFADSRGRSGFGFFLVSMLLSPIIGLVIVLVMPNKIQEEKIAEQRREDHELQLASINAIASRANAATEDQLSVADKLIKLGELRDRGLLTDGEFKTQKASLLSKV